MLEEGTTSSPELLVPPLGPRGSRRAALEAHVREAVRSGRLQPGTRLPSTRALAADLGVSRRLVVDAYAQLTAEGYLVSRRGSGTRVAERARARADRPTSGDRPAAAPARPRWDLFPGQPDLAGFPRRSWGRALREALRELPDHRLGYPHPQGARALRRALADHLGRVRGADADGERVVVTAGFIGGLRLLAGALRRRGATTIAVEDPGFPISNMVLRAAGLRVRPVAVDGRGLRVDDLAGAPADAVLVTPAHQSPTGVVLAPSRRAALLDWAEGTGGLVVEDDYDAEFRYDREPVGTLQGLAPERVVLAGSASKILAPALRLGWLVAPRDLVDELVGERSLHDMGSAALEQDALARLLSGGALDRHLRGCRLRYAARRDALVAALAEHVPHGRVTGVAAGLHAILELPEGTDEAAVEAAAAERGLRVYGLRRHCEGAGSVPPGFVMGYAGLPEPALRRAAQVLGEAVREVAGGPSGQAGR